MRIHHLNCGTFCPVGGPIWGDAQAGALGHLVCHCLLIETNDGLVMVDTGLGVGDIDHPVPRLSALYLGMLNVKLRREDTALAQVEKLGFKARDVRHIVLTHLDFDHAGGLEDFPAATVHVMQEEADAALSRKGFVASRRYRPRQWDEVKTWMTYGPAGEGWFGFDAVRQLTGLPPEILLIPLRGHTLGHAGVAIDTGAGGWLLHCGDAYFHHGEVGRRYPLCPPGQAGYQVLMEADRRSRLKNQARLRQLSVERANEVKLFCAHDKHELERMRGGPLTRSTSTRAAA